MTIQKIVDAVNEKLGGELLTYEEMKIHLDAVIDDINAQLNSCFPAFSDFTLTDYPDRYPNYDFFPDKYIRSVVIVGAAYQFYTTDEEGISTATAYQYEYERNKFYMVRDYINLIPEEYQCDNQGFVYGEAPSYGIGRLF